MSGWRRSFLLIAAFALRTFQLRVEQDGCNHPDLIEKKNCKGYEVGAYRAWTEIQCMDFCLRLDFCDNYIFYGREYREEEHNCKLLKTDVTHVAGSDYPYGLEGRCVAVRSRDKKTPRDFLLGTSHCPDLENGEVNVKFQNE